MATSIFTSRPPQAASASTARDNQRDTDTRPGRGWRKVTRALGLLQLIPALLAAQRPAVQQLFPPEATNYLTDVAGVVDASSATAINDLAARLRKATGVEVAIVTLPTIGEYQPSDVALAIGRDWKVGGGGEIGDSAKNAGIVLLLVPLADHKPGTGHIRFETGRGIEGVITDALAGRITDLMVPDLRQESYGPALLLGVQAIAATVAKGYGISDSVIAASDPFTSQGGGDEQINPIALFIIVVVVLIILSSMSKGGRGGRGPIIFTGGGGGWGGGGWGGGGGFSGGGGGFGGFGGGGGFSGGGAGRSF